MAKTAARKKPAAKRARKPRQLAPKTGKAEPGSERGNFGLMMQRQAGVRVNEDTALTLGAVWACVKVITEDIAGLPWRVREARENGGSDERPLDPADWLLNTEANTETPAFQFRECMVAWALTWGNGYAEIERDMAGRPVWLWQITPERVEPFRADDGRIWYEVTNPRSAPTFLPAADMYHLRGLGFDGLKGYSVIQMAARSIGAGIALDQSTTDLFANDSTPGGILTHPHRLSDPARKNLKESWERRHQGPSNRRRVAILEEGMDWKQTGLPPEDTKLIEQRQFTPADICRWFRVSPVKIQDLLRATFSNIEELAIWHVTDTLLPWVRRLETEANIKLFGRTNRGKKFTKINLNALLRGKTAERWASYKDGLDRGVYSINDVLLLEDMNPIGADGDKRFVQVNMQLLEKAGEEPPPPPPAPPGQQPPPDGGDDDTPPDDMPPDDETMRMALFPVFEDACRRLMRQESNRMKAALQSNNGDLKKLLNKIETEHSLYVRDALLPSVMALSIAHGQDAGDLDLALDLLIARHIEDYKARTVLAVENPKVLDEWEPMAGSMATELIDQLTIAARVAI